MIISFYLRDFVHVHTHHQYCSYVLTYQYAISQTCSSKKVITATGENTVRADCDEPLFLPIQTKPIHKSLGVSSKYGVFKASFGRKKACHGASKKIETDETFKINTSTFYWYLLIKQSQASEDFHPQFGYLSLYNS